jgi:hypothetical protein
MQRSSVFIGNSVFAHAGCAVVAAPAFVCVVVFVMGVKLAGAFKRSTKKLPLTNAFLHFTYANAAKNKLRLKQNRALFQPEN